MSIKGNGESKKIQVLVVIGIIVTVVLAALGYWFVKESFGPSDTYVDWIAYQADYDDPLDLDAIEAELTANNVTYLRQNLTDWTGSYEEIYCNYGPYFNEANTSNTECRIRAYNDGYGFNLYIQIYGADARYGSLNSFKPEYDISMDYIVNIIHDATGKQPIDYEYFYEDGSPLNLPP